MKNALLGICYLAIILLTGCVSYYFAEFDVPKAKSEEAWSKGISYIVRSSQKTIRVSNDYYVDTYPGMNFFSMSREVYPDKTHIVVTSSNAENIDTAQLCKDYILGIKRSTGDGKDDRYIRKTENIQNYEQADISDISTPVLFEMLKITSKDNLKHRLNTFKISKKEAKNSSFTELKKICGYD